MIPAVMQQGMNPMSMQFYPNVPASPMIPKSNGLQPIDSFKQAPLPALPTTPKTQGGGMPNPPGSAGFKPGTTMNMTSNSGLDQSDNIKVVVRVRPTFDKEREGATVVYANEEDASLKVVVSGPGGATMSRDFQFHACLGPETRQNQVIEMCGIFQLMDAALSGYNVTIFAYGQTGSGKTYTMSGKEEVIGDDAYTGDHHNDGIITRAMNYIFQTIQQRRDAKYSLSASYLEIYNEGIYDLINFKQRNLPVKWDANQGFYVPGLKIMQCSTINTIMEVIRTGMKHRRVGSHELNIESSRSHSIFTIYCDATPTDPNSFDYGTARYGKVSFVDLAGSERLKDSKSEGQMLKETTNINKSLFVLGKVISALAERDSNGTSAHIPYRDSKLTKLLMDSLGGSALALMIACCSPSSLHVEETLSTLTYATRAKNIQNRPTVQYDPKEAQLALLRRELDLLRQENSYLKEQLKMGSTISSFPQTPVDFGAPPGSAQAFPPPPRNTSPNGGDLNVTFQSQNMAGLRPPVPPGHQPWPKLTAFPANPGSQGGAWDPTAGAIPSPTAVGPQGLPVHEWRQLEPLRSLNSSQGPAGSLAAAVDLRPSPSRDSKGMYTDFTNAKNASVSASIEGAEPIAGSRNGRRSSIDDTELIRRLKETQALLSRFSEENSRLARENDRLLSTRQMLSSEHATVLDEIDSLRGKLSVLELSVKSGSQPINQAKAILNSYKTSTPLAGQMSGIDLPSPNYTPQNGQRPAQSPGYAALHATPQEYNPDDDDLGEDDDGPEDPRAARQAAAARQAINQRKVTTPTPVMSHYSPPPSAHSTSPSKAAAAAAARRSSSGGGMPPPPAARPPPGKGKAREDDGIIVADKSKLSLLFDEGGDSHSVAGSLDLAPVPPHMRPVPQKPPPGQGHYANPLKESYEQDRLKKMGVKH